ncbi:hypothetical protein AB0F71_12230 [Kitasatospora sp. NPDC028055]
MPLSGRNCTTTPVRTPVDPPRPGRLLAHGPREGEGSLTMVADLRSRP